MITNLELRTRICTAFLEVYGKMVSDIFVSGEGTDEVTVKVGFPDQAGRTFVADLASNDDGYYHFRLQDSTNVVVLVLYGDM